MTISEKKIFGTLFFSVFAAITGVGIVVPLLPVYARDLGAGGFYIAMIFGVFSLSRTFFLPYFGRQSDLKGRKPYIVLGLLGYVALSAAFMAASRVEALIAVRCAQGIASAMIWPAAQAYVGDMAPENKEGAVMGFFNMATFAGLSMGPFAGGFINEHFSIDITFICMGALALCGLLLSLFLLPSAALERIAQRDRIRQSKSPAQNSFPHRNNWWVLMTDHEIFGLFAFRLAFTACIGIIWGFLPVYADARFALSSSRIGIIITLGVFVSGILQTPMGVMADRMDRRTMVGIGGMITMLSVFGFTWAKGFDQILLANIFFGIGGGISTAPLMAMAVKTGARRSAMGSVMAILTMGHSIGMVGGSFGAGLMMDFFGLQYAFACGSLMMAAGVVIFLVFTDARSL